MTAANDNEKPIEISLTASYVTFGGNTGNGEYFYAFDKNTLLFTKPGNYTISITLSKSTPKHFEIYSFICSNDTGNITRDESITSLPNNITLKNNNSSNQSINLSIVMYDTVEEKYFSCDPQVLNSPDPD
jgi:hypothetical protein